MRADKLCETIREAFALAKSGRPGPVLVDIPKDIQNTEIEYEFEESSKSFEKYKEVLNVNHNRQKFLLVKAAEAINRSERPVIYAGGGVKIANAVQELRDFALKIKAPVSTSLMGTGVFPGEHDQFLGMVGMHGFKHANLAFDNSDLIIAVGARFSDRATCKTDGFATNAEVIQIDIDPAELGKNIEVGYPLSGDVKDVLNELNKLIEEKPVNGWLKQVKEYKDDNKLNYNAKGELCPKFLLETINRVAGENITVTTEVGQHQMWTAQYYKFNDPRSFLTSGGLGTMGFGLGAAIGAAMGRPDRKTINIAGDGSFRMNINELATLSRYNIPVKQIVMNNSALGMVKQWQKILFEKKYSHTQFFDVLDFAKIAEAFGVKGLRIEKNEDVERVLLEALNHDGPVVIDCIISSEDLVLPMVLADRPICECNDDY